MKNMENKNIEINSSINDNDNDNEESKLLEQLSAAIDDEDNIPLELFDKTHRDYSKAQALWNASCITRNYLQQNHFNFYLNDNLNNKYHINNKIILTKIE